MSKITKACEDAGLDYGPYLATLPPIVRDNPDVSNTGVRGIRIGIVPQSYDSYGYHFSSLALQLAVSLGPDVPYHKRFSVSAPVLIKSVWEEMVHELCWARGIRRRPAAWRQAPTPEAFGAFLQAYMARGYEPNETVLKTWRHLLPAEIARQSTRTEKPSPHGSRFRRRRRATPAYA